MKKQIFLLMAGGIMLMASCTQPADTGASDAQVDSMVNARVEEIRAEMMAQNDSLINVMAQMKADSMIAAMKGKPTPRKAAPAPKKVTESATQPAEPAQPSGTSNPKEKRFGGEGSGTDNKAGRFDKDAKQKEADEKAKKKGERFK